MPRLWALTVLAVAVPAAVSAQSYGHGRIRHVEDGVSIQRATETGSEDAVANLPFLPGDRVWTDEGGRAEFQFAGGSLLRLDLASKLDYVAHDDDSDDRIVLRLWSGALFLHARDGRDGPFEIETPGGVVVMERRGVLRIDVDSGETRLSVYEGEASLDGARSVRLEAGERVHARRGEIEEDPAEFDRGEGDEFTAWSDARQERSAYAGRRPAALPDEVLPYGDELDRHGSWYYESEIGHVWRPYVAATWQPYSHGRWVWTVFGWTWVPYESWGWAVSHYGRWGHAPALGWYWIPGRRWGPAWVSWAVGGDYVGWCPLGYRDRPVLVYDRFGRGHRGGRGSQGHAVPRGVQVVASPWIYLRRGDLSARDVARRRVQLDSTAVSQVRLVDDAQTRVTRDVSIGAIPAAALARPVPRQAARRPAAGAVPEARPDPMTSVPVARRRGRDVPSGEDRGQVRSGAGSGSASGAVRSGEGSPEAPAAARRRGVHPTDVRSGQGRAGEDAGSVAIRRRRYDAAEARTPDRPAGEAAPRERGAVAREREGADADREVLRPMFRPLGRRRGETGGDANDAGASWRRRREAEPRRGGDEAGRAGVVREPRGGGEAPRGGREGAVRRGGDEPRALGGRPREEAPRQAAPRESRPAPRPEAQAAPRPHQPRPAAAERRPRNRDQ